MYQALCKCLYTHYLTLPQALSSYFIDENIDEQKT